MVNIIAIIHIHGLAKKRLKLANNKNFMSKRSHLINEYEKFLYIYIFTKY